LRRSKRRLHNFHEKVSVNPCFRPGTIGIVGLMASQDRRDVPLVASVVRQTHESILSCRAITVLAAGETHCEVGIEGAKRKRGQTRAKDARSNSPPRKLLNPNLRSVQTSRIAPVCAGALLGATRRCVSHRVLALPNMLAAGAVHGIGRLSLGELLFAHWAWFSNYVRHTLGS
jgi:hypothetical protein